MTHRPYPNRDRALRHLRHMQAVYLYGRVPARYVLGFDQTPTEEVLAIQEAVRRMAFHADLASHGFGVPVDLDRLDAA
ncbi:hypothetical protein [Streptomyces sp. SPB074]|uniref:hypothetical protein n=1 Tax=Streptomyces sp. (strain SPB074) TaxID=465543 RepID=UPI00017F1038|nr:hypothetical protein [Streptomyces sp. SPB074]